MERPRIGDIRERVYRTRISEKFQVIVGLPPYDKRERPDRTTFFASFDPDPGRGHGMTA